MTVKELLKALADADPDAQVRIGSQPSYPFQSDIAAVVGADEIDLATLIDLGHDADGSPVGSTVRDDGLADYVSDYDGRVALDTVYILTGDQVGYLPAIAWDVR